MALCKAGGGVTDLRGSISGNTFSRNRGGMIVRARTVPTNTRSNSQSQSRSLFAFLTSAWNKDLTSPQQTAWDTYAHAVSSKNKLGENIHLTGQLQFIRTNQVRMTAGLSLSPDGPAVLSLPETDPTMLISEIYDSLLSISFDNTQAWRTENGGALSIIVSRPQPATKNYFTGPWRFAGAIVGSSTSPPTSPAVIPLPFPVSANQKIFAKACILRADGRTTNPFNLPPKIITASFPPISTGWNIGYTIFDIFTNFDTEMAHPFPPITGFHFYKDAENVPIRWVTQWQYDYTCLWMQSYSGWTAGSVHRLTYDGSTPLSLKSVKTGLPVGAFDMICSLQPIP